MLIAMLYSSLRSYPLKSNTHRNIQRGIGLTRLWYNRHKVQTNPVVKIQSFIIFNIHLGLTFIFLSYAYRYEQNSPLSNRVKDHL